MKSVLITLLTLSAALWGQKKLYPERWVYVSSELGTDQALQGFRDIARTASEHGLTAILFSSAFDRLDLQPPGKHRQAQTGQEYLRTLSPRTCAFDVRHGIRRRHSVSRSQPRRRIAGQRRAFHSRGRAGTVLARKLHFIRQRRLQRHRGGRPGGYLPGVNAAIDTTVFHSGNVSLRLMVSVGNRTTAPTSFNTLPSSLTASTG